MVQKDKSRHFSPSLYHHHTMRDLEPSMAYDGGDITTWQRRLRRKLRQLVALTPNTNADLNVTTIWQREHPLGTIEKIVFTSEPCADVPAYVCLPKTGQKPYPFMICLQGHTTGMHHSIAVQRENEKRKMSVEGDRDFALGCMQRGVAALCIEQRSFGERREQHQQQLSPHGCHDAVMHSLLLGQTLIGERVFDVDRAIDYLTGRDDVDTKRIGLMGNSGGGTITMYASALLPRIQFAMPSCAFCTLAESSMSIYHCADNYIPGLLRYAEMADVLGLFAPKPITVVAGKEDTIFPITGVRKAFRQLKRIYTAAGVPNNCRLVVGDQGHQFYADKAWPTLLPHLNKTT